MEFMLHKLKCWIDFHEKAGTQHAEPTVLYRAKIEYVPIR